MVDFDNDLLRKRKSVPTGWQAFAQQPRSINLPMDLVGNVARRSNIRRSKTTPRPAAVTTPRATIAAGVRRSLRWTPLVRRQQMEQSNRNHRNDARPCRHWLVERPIKGGVLRVDSIVCVR